MLSRAKLVVALKLAITGVLFYFVFESVEPSRALEQLVRLNPALVAGCLLIVLLQVGLGSFRWAILARRVLGDRLCIGVALGLSLVGLFFNQFLVSTIGGDAVRAWGAHLRGVNLRNALVSVALDRMTGLASLAILVAVGIPLLLPMTDEWTFVGSILLGAVLVLAGVATFLVLERVLGFLPQNRVVRFVISMASDMRRLLRNPRLFAVAVGLSCGAHLLYVALAVLITRALGEPLAPLTALAIIPAVTLVAALPISIAGWGAREGAMVVAASLVGLGAETAVILSVVVGLLNLGASLPGGVLWAPLRIGELPEDIV